MDVKVPLPDVSQLAPEIREQVAKLPPLNVFIVTIALPSIRDSLQANSSETSLIISGYAAAFAVNLIGCFTLAPAYGGVGAASATAAAFIVESSLLFVIARRRLGFTMFVWRPRSA